MGKDSVGGKKEGKVVICASLLGMSLRMQALIFKEKYGLDIVEDVNPLHLRRPGERYFRSANDIEEWVINEQEKYLEMAREVFGPLLGR